MCMLQLLKVFFVKWFVLSVFWIVMLQLMMLVMNWVCVWFWFQLFMMLKLMCFLLFYIIVGMIVCSGCLCGLSVLVWFFLRVKSVLWLCSMKFVFFGMKFELKFMQLFWMSEMMLLFLLIVERQIVLFFFFLVIVVNFDGVILQVVLVMLMSCVCFLVCVLLSMFLIGMFEKCELLMYLSMLVQVSFLDLIIMCSVLVLCRLQLCSGWFFIRLSIIRVVMFCVLGLILVMVQLWQLEVIGLIYLVLNFVRFFVVSRLFFFFEMLMIVWVMVFLQNLVLLFLVMLCSVVLRLGFLKIWFVVGVLLLIRKVLVVFGCLVSIFLECVQFDEIILEIGKLFLVQWIVGVSMLESGSLLSLLFRVIQFVIVFGMVMV